MPKHKRAALWKKTLVIQALFCIMAPLVSFAQEEMPDDFNAGKKLYGENRYEEAVSYFYKAAWELNKQQNKSYSTYAAERTIINYIDSAYRAAAKNEIPFKVDFDSTRTEKRFYLVSQVKEISNDSAVITINEGKQDGIFTGAECYLAGAFSSKATDSNRSLKYLGSAKIISLTEYTTTLKIKLYEKRKGYNIYPKDLVEVWVHPVRNLDTNIICEFQDMAFRFNDNSNLPIISDRVVYQNTNPALYSVLCDVYAGEINDFASTLNELDDTSFTVKYKTGRFKGYNLKEIFPATAGPDIMAFFNFVFTYPGKYTWKNWKINETYATWMINNMPMGDKNRTWFVPVIEAAERNRFESLVKKYRFYFESDTLSMCESRLDELINQNNLEGAKNLCEKLLFVAKYIKDSAATARFYYRMAYMKNGEENKKEALANILQAYNLYKDTFAYAFATASFYAQNERYDSAFIIYKALLQKYPESSTVKGSYGWYKILEGNLDEAIPYCRDAYMIDTYSHSWTVNYGHTFLLKGNVDSAKYYYAKMLNNLYNPKDYTDGAKKDFDIFFSRGWQRKNVADIMEWLDAEFKQKYYYITTANTVWDEAKKHYDAKEYKLAIAGWKEFLQLHSHLQEPRYATIRGVNTWIGSCFDRMNQNDSAIKYYSIAHEITKLYLTDTSGQAPGSEYLVSDYQNLHTLYGNNKKYAYKAEAYKTLYDAETQKLADMKSKPRLHVLCIGGIDTSDSRNYELNAKYFFDSISAIGSKSDSGTGYLYLKGKDLTKQSLIQKLDDIRKQTRPEDIFVLFYAGITVTDSNRQNDAFCFNPKDSATGRITIKELLQDVGLLYAKKKVIITSEPNPAALTLLATQYGGSSDYAGEVVFLCPGIKTPPTGEGYSMFTHELVNALTELKKKSKFSAREFVDKAATRIGREQHYMPVLSFNYGKDFMLYKNDSLRATTAVATIFQSRGLEINDGGDNSSRAEANVSSQKNYALFFASDNYDDGYTWHKLSNPIADATALSGLLSEDYGFQVELVKNATKKEIENKLREYRNKSFNPNDQLMIFFAGHGIYYSDANMGYLVARDSKDPRTTDPNYNTYLSYSDLGNIYLKNLKCRRIFLVLDACYAGSFFEQKSYRSGPDMRASDANVMQRLSMLKKNANGKTFYKGVSSGGKETVEDGRKDEHSPFAGSLIQMLNNAIANHYITADAIIGEIQNSHPGNTTPSSGTFNYSDPQGIFIFESVVKEVKTTVGADNVKR